MALHKDLEIYQVGYDLLLVAIDAVRVMPRDIKKVLGEPLLEDCKRIALRIRRANMAADKEPHLLDLLERVEVIELGARASRDKAFIPNSHYARIIQHTQSIGKQANAWRRDGRQQQDRQQLSLYGD